MIWQFDAVVTVLVMTMKLLHVEPC